MENPYESPSEARNVSRRLGGIRRLPFSILILGLYFLFFYLAGGMPAGLDGIGLLALWIFTAVSFCVVFGLRLKNMGASPAFAFLIFVPIVNLVLTIFCLSYPEGAHDGQKWTLDKTGRRILIGLAIAFVVAVGGVFICTALVIQSIGR